MTINLYAHEKETNQAEPLSQQTGKVKLDLVEETNIDLDNQMEMAQAQGRSFIFWEKKLTFFSKKHKIIKTLEIPNIWCDVFSSANGQYIGVRYLTYGLFPDNEDRFIFFNVSGEKIWELFCFSDHWTNCI